MWAWDSMLPQRDLSSQHIPPDALLPHMGAGTAHFASPPLLPALMQPLLYILSHKELCSASPQMVLKVDCTTI